MRFNFRYTLSLLLVAAFGALLVTPGCKDTKDNPQINQVKEFSNEVVWEWNELFLQVERYAAGYRPGPAPRALALLGLAAYEASLQGMPDYNSVAARYPGL